MATLRHGVYNYWVPGLSWASVTPLASPGKVLRFGSIYGCMLAEAAGAKVLITINDTTLGVIASASNTDPGVVVKSEVDFTLFADDTSGPKIYGYNTNTSDRGLRFGFNGIEE